MNTKIATLLLLLVLTAITPACDDDDNQVPSTTVQLQATLNGQQEVPATPSSATGAFTGSYDKITRVLSYTVTYQGITPSAGHIHEGAPGVNGGVMVPFTSLSPSPITGTATLSEADGDKLLLGQTYVNLHTPAFPGGEIRGNITVR